MNTIIELEFNTVIYEKIAYFVFFNYKTKKKKSIRWIINKLEKDLGEEEFKNSKLTSTGTYTNFLNDESIPDYSAKILLDVFKLHDEFIVHYSNYLTTKIFPELSQAKEEVEKSLREESEDEKDVLRMANNIPRALDSIQDENAKKHFLSLLKTDFIHYQKKFGFSLSILLIPYIVFQVLKAQIASASTVPSGTAGSTLTSTVTATAVAKGGGAVLLTGVALALLVNAYEVAEPTYNEILNTLSCKTDGAKIYYTWDKNKPTEQSQLYDKSVTLPDDVTYPLTLKARAYLPNPEKLTDPHFASDVMEVIFKERPDSGKLSIEPPPLPEPEPCDCIDVEIACTKGDPSNIQDNGEDIFWSCCDYNQGCKVSKTRVGNTFFVTTFPGSGIVEKGTEIEFLAFPDNVDIYYTTNGKPPTTSSPKYDKNPIPINVDTTIRAITHMTTHGIDIFGEIIESEYIIEPQQIADITDTTDFFYEDTETEKPPDNLSEKHYKIDYTDDFILPESKFLYPHAKAHLKNVNKIIGQSTDNKAVNYTRISIQDTYTGKYYSGSGFTEDTETWLNTNGSTINKRTRWWYQSPVWVDFHSYIIRSRAMDTTGNEEPEYSNETWIINN